MDYLEITPDRASGQIPTFKPSPKEERYVSDAITYTVMRAPMIAHLLYNEMQVHHSKAIPYAATDYHSIYFNVERMIEAGMGFEEAAFVVMHEVLHRMLDDLVIGKKFREEGEVHTPYGVFPYDHELMNAAMDYRINAILIDGKYGKMPKVGLFDPKISEKGMESAVEIYGRLYQQSPPQGKGGGKPGNQPGGAGSPGAGAGPGGQGFDKHLEPSEKAVEDQVSGKTAQAIVAAAAVAQGQGDLPGALKVLLGEILDPHVPWQEFLKSTMMRAAGDPAYDWRYLDKRLLVRDPQMYFARQSHMGAGTVVIGYDTSGSCVNPSVQQRFFSEMSGIIADVNPAQLVVIWCDAAVQRVDELEEPEDLEELRLEINKLGGAPGGGGTDFRPVFREIEERGLQPDMLVYLTDTEGSFPANEPDYPCIWASIKKGATVPWGDIVEVEL